MKSAPILPACLKYSCYRLHYLPIIFMLITQLAPLSAYSRQGGKTLNAVPAEGPIKLDGFLTEASWKNAEPLTDFTQREPNEGEAPTEKTEIRILFDEDNLYIGAVCYDSEPDRIVRKELMWDGDLEGDDIITVVLDTFNDQRSGFYFSTNSNGAMHDALIKNVEEINEDWDGIWEVKARITEHGWTAELVIPFMTLRFPKTEVQHWCVNFMRQIRRKNEEVLWTAWGREDGILQISEAGRLEGLTRIKRGRLTEFKPYLLGGAEKEEGKDLDDTFKYGIDIKYPLTSDLTFDFTTKTDFAQVESDKEKINLTRFSLEYPEKRGFFLEGAEIYDFTQGDSSHGGVKLFYSRRIGITPDPDRQQVPILGGAKLSGKSGPYSIGVMSMQTEEKTVTTDEGTKNFYPSTNYTVLRVKRDVLKQSYIGVVGTIINRAEKPDNPPAGDPENDRFINRRENYMGAVDFAYNTNTFIKDKNFSVQGYLSATSTPDLEDGNIAGRISVDYPNDLIDAYFFYHAVGNNFNPELGFLHRHGIREYNTALKYMPRVNLPFIRKFVFQPCYLSYITNTGTKMLSRTINLQPLGAILENGDEFSFQRHFHYEYLDYYFEVYDEAVIPVGSHKFSHWYVRYESVKSRAVSVDLMTSWGGFYNGRRKYYSAAFTFKFNRFLAVTSDISMYDIDLKDDSFIARNASLKLQTNLSTRLTSSTFVQWNNHEGEANMNFRIHYIPQIGSDIYIAYNQIWDEEDDMRTLYNAGIVKVDYLLRF